MLNRNVFAEPIQTYLRDYSSARLEVTLTTGDKLRVQNINATDDCVAFRVYPRHALNSDLHESREGFDTIIVPYELIATIRITATDPHAEPIATEIGFHTAVTESANER